MMHQPIEEVENRTTAPDYVGWSAGEHPAWYWLPDYYAGSGQVRVNHHTALTYSAFWACVRVIAQTIAALGWAVYERQGDGRSKLPVEDDVAWLLGMQANPEMSALDWRQVLVKDALTWGNGYAEIERDRAGRPLWMWRLSPERVWLERDDDTGRLYYRIDGSQGDVGYLDPANVFHLKGLSPDGLVGYSVVAMHRRAIGLGMSTEQYGATFFERGPMPGGVLKMPVALSEKARSEARGSFERVYGGAANAGRVVVLTAGMEFAPFTLPNDDAQFLESRQFSAEEVCGIFGVPPHKIGRLEKSTNNNIEHQAIEFVQDCLLPWCRRLECEADVKLFGRVNRGRRFTRLNLSSLLRGDSATQTDTVVKKVVSGIMTINEGREYLDLNPHPDGDDLLIQGAMVPVTTILHPPEPPPPPAPMPQSEPSKNGNGRMPAEGHRLP